LTIRNFWKILFFCSENFTQLAISGFYNGVTFHRIVRDFILRAHSYFPFTSPVGKFVVVIDIVHIELVNLPLVYVYFRGTSPENALVQNEFQSFPMGIFLPPNHPEPSNSSTIVFFDDCALCVIQGGDPTATGNATDRSTLSPPVAASPHSCTIPFTVIFFFGNDAIIIASLLFF